MRVGVIVDNELNDDKRVLREIEILKETGYEIFVLCFGFTNRSYGSIEGVDISRIHIRKKTKDILFFLMNSIPAYEWFWSSKVKEFITANKINILHVHDLYMARASWSGINKSGIRIPMILDLHENYPYAVTTYNWTKGFFRSLISKPRKWKKKEKKYLSYPRKIVVLSSEFRDYLINEYEFLTSERFCIFPNVPDTRQIQNTKIQRDNIAFVKKASVLLYFGVVAERRGIFNAITSFSDVIEKGYNVDFLIIGPVDKKDRKRFFESISFPAFKNRITYIPWIDISELPSYLDLCDICLAPFHKNPQHESGVANKIFDYMAGGKPIVASDCLPQKNLIEKHNCGIIYRSQTEFTDSIILLLSDNELRKRMGENGYKAVFSEFNIENKRSSLIDAYNSLLIN